MSGERQAIIVGGGITGLACAYWLRRAGVGVSLFESSDRPGGIVATCERNGFLFESGPQCPRFSRRLWDLVREIGLEREFVPGDAKAPRYILRDQRLRKVPFSPWGFLTTDLVGVPSKLRLLSEGFRRSKLPDKEETLAELVRRKFDSDVLDFLVDPIISTVYAGDAEKIGVRSAFPFLERWEEEHGSLLRGAIHSRRQGASSAATTDSDIRTKDKQGRSLVVTDALPPLGSFRQGLGTLPKRLAESLGDSLCLKATVESVEYAGSKGRVDSSWRVRLNGGEEISAGFLILAVPAFEAARLLKQAVPEAASQLAEISYAPMAVASAGYLRSQVSHPLEGFGFMIPRRENLNTFFCIWNSSVLEERAPGGMVLVTGFAGGATNPTIAKLDDGSIAQTVERETGGILGIDGPPVERLVWNYQKALPQFNVGHSELVSGIRRTIGGAPGLYLAGNYLAGRSLGECAEIAFRTAEEVKRQSAL